MQILHERHSLIEGEEEEEDEENRRKDGRTDSQHACFVFGGEELSLRGEG